MIRNEGFIIWIRPWATVKASVEVYVKPLLSCPVVNLKSAYQQNQQSGSKAGPEVDGHEDKLEPS